MIIRNGVEGVRAFMQKEIEKKGWGIRELSEESGVSQSAIRKFVSEDTTKQTKSPHFRTLYNTVQAMGYVLHISNR